LSLHSALFLVDEHAYFSCPTSQPCAVHALAARDETLDPQWHIPSEFLHGTFADYAVVPRRNAIPLRENLSPPIMPRCLALPVDVDGWPGFTGKGEIGSSAAERLASAP
jgi:hypothetical protein